MKKMDVKIRASNEGSHRVLREIDRKRLACMKEAGKQQNAKRIKKAELFYIILFLALILLAVIRVVGPIAMAVWNIF